jgi:ubiquinone/menaquinone biosynthesis C-methylase UbiE
MKNIIKMMERSWDFLAEKNAPHFTDPEKIRWNFNEYFAKGEREVGLFTQDIIKGRGLEPNGKRMLEIGCGIGRQTRAFSKMFGEVDALDISNSMITKAQELNNDLKNVKFMKSNGRDFRDFPDNYFDFVYSYGTFQHIPNNQVISSYFQEISRVLKIGGLFKIHLATNYVHHDFWFLKFGFTPILSFMVEHLPFKIINIIMNIYDRLLSMPEGLSPGFYVGTRTSISVTSLTKIVQNSTLTLLTLSKQELYHKLVNTWCVGQKDY